MIAAGTLTMVLLGAKLIVTEELDGATKQTVPLTPVCPNLTEFELKT